MKNSLTLLFVLLGSIVYGQNKVYDYAYMNKNGICVYSIVDKKEYPIIKMGLNPCISPDGKKVAYTAYNKKNERFIAVMDIDTKKSIILNTKSNNCYGPVWSPDGKFIAYNVFDDKRKDWSVAIIDTNKISAKVTTLPFGKCYMPTWSYDSKNVVVQNMKNVFIMDISGKIISTVSIKDIDNGIAELTKDVGPSSSDRFIFTNYNKNIVFTSEVNEPDGDDGPPTSVFIYDIIHKSTLRLSPKGYFAQHIVIKGDKILITAAKIKSSTAGIYTVDMDGKNFKMLLPNCSEISAKN